MSKITIKPKFKMGELVEFKDLNKDPYYIAENRYTPYYVWGFKHTQIELGNSEIKYWEYLLLEECNLDMICDIPFEVKYLRSAKEDLLTLVEIEKIP